MRYKTMVLALLEESPALHDQLRRERLLLPALNHLANELKASHLAWKERLAPTMPASGASQLASAALELALQELQERLPGASPPDGSPRPSVAETVAHLRSRMSSG